jgi:hypothetical protein
MHLKGIHLPPELQAESSAEFTRRASISAGRGGRQAGCAEFAIVISVGRSWSKASQPVDVFATQFLCKSPRDAMTDRRPTFTIDRAHYPKASGRYEMSEHALRRMYARSLSPGEVRRALRFGRVVFARGAAHFVLGKNEVARYAPVAPEDDGLQLVVSRLADGTVLTLYRNKEDLPRA